MSQIEPPNSLRALEKRISNDADGSPITTAKNTKTLSMIVLAQMMPPGAIKGGTAMKIRLGDRGRFSLDIDVARAQATAEFERTLAENLETGWADFSGTVSRKRGAANPDGIPVEYIMIPYRVKLFYKGSHWRTVDLEVGHDELGDTEDFELRMDPAIIDLFNRLGLPSPDQVPLLAVKHQVAQKIHGASNEIHHRPHDLVDLQLLIKHVAVNLPEVREVCVQLFPFRKRQSWPPVVTMAGDDLNTLYTEASDGMNVLPNLPEAVTWANSLIDQIEKS